MADRSPLLSACPLCREAACRPFVEFPELLFVTCAACGVIYKREQRADAGGTYEQDYFCHGGARYLHRWEHRVRKARRQLRDALAFAPGARRLLDVGCSAGYVLEAGRQLGLDPTGLDCSRFAVEACQRRGLAAVAGDWPGLPFAPESFDLITAKHVLEHLVDPLAGLADLARVLRPGGVALIVVPDPRHFKRYLRRRGGSYFNPRRTGWQHHVYLDAEQLGRAVERAGLRVCHTGKAVARPTAGAWASAGERLRRAAAAAVEHLAVASHTRREIQLLAGKA